MKKCQIKNKIDPSSITISSQIKVWWKCKNGIDHSWQETPSNRLIRGCPYCSNKRVSLTNRLDKVKPQSIKIWSDNNKTKPSDYTYKNGKDDILWNCCSCNEEFCFQKLYLK